MLTRRAFVTLVDVDVTFSSDEAAGAATSVASVDHAGFANRPRIARVRGTGVVQVAQKTCFVGWAFTNVAGHTIMTSSTIETRLDGTVVHINLAIVALVAVDANARVTTLGIVTRGAVLAHVGPRCAFINVLSAKAPRVFRGAIAGIRADSIHASSPVLAEVSIAIVLVDVAARAGKTSRTRA